MPSLKRRLADAVGHALGAHIVPRDRVASLYEQECIRRIFNEYRVDCVFDVGANAGQYATMLRERLSYEGPIISFEPSPELAEHLVRRAAGDPHWHVRNVALDSEVRDVVFRITADSQFSSLQRPSGTGQAIFGGQMIVEKELPITTSTLASEIASWQRQLGFQRPYLKMDTQGNDLAVAEGAGLLLSSFVAIQTETAITKIYESMPDLGETLRYFREHGFDISAFVPNNDGLFPRIIETDCIFVNKALMPAADAPA